MKNNLPIPQEHKEEYNGINSYKMNNTEKTKGITKMVVSIALVIGIIIVVIILAAKVSSNQAYELLKKIFELLEEIKPYFFLFCKK